MGAWSRAITLRRLLSAPEDPIRLVGVCDPASEPAGTVDVFTPDARGEQQVHGSRAAWLAFSGDAGDQRRPYTLVFVPGDTPTAADRWFVEGYPGVGSALAFDDVLVLRPEEPQRRHIRVHGVDGPA